ncbi:reverse transcriptase domain-containing protein [Tanacetum coccineum]
MSPQEEGENLNSEAPRTGRTPPGGISALAEKTHGGPSPAFVKEKIDVLRTKIKELDNKMSREAEEVGGYSSDGSSRSRSREARSRSKSKSVKSQPQSVRASRRKSSSDSGYDTVSDSGNKDSEDHLSIFSAAAEQEEWPMQVWCKMFRHTLSGSTRNWFDSLAPKSLDGFKELSNKFLEEFSQQKRYDKDPTEIHGIKRKPNEGLQAFMDRFKAESAHIKGVPPVLRISAFMHGHGHPELAKKLNDKIPKIVDEMWERVRAFIKGETAADTTKAIRSPRWEKSAEGFTPLTTTPKEILSMDNVNFPPPPLMIEEAVTSGRLAHLVKDIRQGGQKSKGSAKGKEKVINMVRSKGYRKRPYERVEHCWLGSSVGEVSYPLGVIDLEVTIGEYRKTQTNIMEFAVVKSPSSYNALLGRKGMGSLRAVASTIHSMIKFPTSNGIATISTTRETLKERRQIKEAQSQHARVTDPTPMQTSSEVANPRVSLAPVKTRSRKPGKEPMQLDYMEERRQLEKGRKPPKSNVEEKIVINDNYPE